MASLNAGDPPQPWGRLALAAEVVAAGVLGTLLTLVLGFAIHPAFYKTDGPDLCWAYWEVELGRQLGIEPGIDQLTHRWHVGALRLFEAMRSLLPDLELWQVGKVLSAVGVGVAVACTLLGLRWLGAKRSVARGATALVAVCPSVLLFGSVVEVHGAALGAAAMGFAGMALLYRVRRCWCAWGWALLLGVVFHFGFTAHSTGLVLPALWLSWLVAASWVPQRESSPRFPVRVFALGVVAGLVHLALFFAMPKAFPLYYGAYADLEGAFALEADIARPQGMGYAGEVLMQEWVVPLLPLSVAVLGALLVRGLRLVWVAFAVGFVPLLVLATRQLVFEPEYGGYLLPALIPAAYLTVAWIHRLVPKGYGVAIAALALLSAGLGVWRTVDVDAWPSTWRPVGRRPAVVRAEYDAMAAAFAELGGKDEAFVLVNTPREMAVAMVAIGAENFFWMVRQSEIDPAQVRESAGLVLGYLHLLRQRGLTVYITETAWEDLERPTFVDPIRPHRDPVARSGPVLRQAFAQAFNLEPVTAAGLTFLRLVPR